MKRSGKLLSFVGVLCVVSLACNNPFYGFGKDLELIGTLTAVAEVEQQQTEAAAALTEETVTTPEKPEATTAPAEPTTAAVITAEAISQGSEDTQTYSVEGTNYGCTCQSSGNDIAVTFNNLGDTLEVQFGEGEPTVYTKTGENTYTYEYLGYYISNTDSGSTQVDNPEKNVIVLQDSGFILERYSEISGGLDSPCCFFTYTDN